MVKITYFVHGTTTDNEQNKATGWLPGELSKLGKQQAKELRDHVSSKHFNAFFCSDLKRAVDSANLGFGDTYDIVPDKRLRECNYGNINGEAHDFKENMADFIDAPFPNGESYRDVEKRMANFLTFLKENHDEKHVALLAHQAPQLALEVLLNGQTWEQAIRDDWRKRGSWQPGWEHTLE